MNMTNQHAYSLTLVSKNKKTGPIPVSTSSASTCPSACPFIDEGCYAETGPVSWSWKKLNKGLKGVDFKTFCRMVAKLPKGALWRYSQAGDLPGDSITNVLNRKQCLALAKAAAARRKETILFSHYPMEVKSNREVIQEMARIGLHVTLSANNMEHADALADLGIAPVATVLPHTDLGKKRTKTPAGRDVLVCPATWPGLKNMTCKRCGICAQPNHILVGFPAHGARKAAATRVYFKGIEIAS